MFYVKRWRMFVIEAEFELLGKQDGCVGECVCFPFNILSIGLIGYNAHYAAAAAGSVHQHSLQFVSSA